MAAPAAQRDGGGPRADPAAGRLPSLDAILLDPQRLYDATFCSPDEFDYLLHLYEQWARRHGLDHLFRSEAEDDPGNRGRIHLRHALLMGLVDKRANTPMRMLASLFGTDRDGTSTYLGMTDKALVDVLSLPDTKKKSVWSAAEAAGDLTGFDIDVPMATPWDPVRSRTAKNYPGLLQPKRAGGKAAATDTGEAARRVEKARAARSALDVRGRILQYRRMTDPYTGYPGLDIEFAVISGLENLHTEWEETRRQNEPLLRDLARKRDSWVRGGRGRPGGGATVTRDRPAEHKIPGAATKP